LIQRLSEETDAKYISDLSLILYDQARLMDGAKLDDPATFVASLNRLMSLSVVKKQVDRRSKSMKMNNS
jgi:molecular chaperone HtpG